MLLRQISAKNFRLLEDFDLELSDAVTILVGPNNAGKSNIVDALLLVRRALDVGSLHGALSERHGWERVVTRHQGSASLSLAFVFSRDDGDFRYALDLDLPSQSLGETDPGGGIQRHMAQDQLFLASGISGFTAMEAFFRGIVHIDPFRQIALQAAVGPAPMVQASGSDLARVLHHYYTSDRERFDAFEDVVRRVLPEVEMIETPLVGEAQATVHIRFVGEGEKYDLWQLSSGVKDTLVLLSAIHFSPRGSFLMIEEPENHLHPAAQKALAAVIRDAAASEGKQSLVTTHSELVMEQFEPTQVFFVDRRQGRAEATRLEDAKVFEVWERLGIERTRLLEALGRARQVILVIEGRDDLKALEPVWEHYELADKVLPARASGGGYRAIVDGAVALQLALDSFRLNATVFVLLDNDGEGDAKRAYLEEQGLDENRTHVWKEKELESYLLIPPALAAISRKPEEEVLAAIEDVRGGGKEKLDAVLRKLGTPDVGKGTIVVNAVRAGDEHVPAEFKEVVGKVKDLMGIAAPAMD